ncbi:hypothetical protein KBC03_01575 [Patescibacteria group bacterium]|nr:hypothetical protein [Patescibacteria group bacterium]
MGNVFEFKLQLPGSNLVDKISTSEMAKDFSELVDKFKQEFADVKEKVENSKVYKEAKNAVKKFPLLYADPAKLTLTVGETSFQAKDDKEFAKYEKMLNQTLGDANEELANSEHLKTLEEEEALKKARKESETVKDDVTETTKKADKDVEKSEGETYETFSKSSQLEARYKAAQAAPSDDAEFNMTREEERLQRLTEKLQASTSEAQRERISKRIDKLSRKIAHRRARTTDHMANAADNYVRGEKMEHQMWYYNDIINALTKDKKSNRVHYFDDYILIDTYHPLFKNKDNSNGTIKLTGESVDAYMEHTPDGKRYTAEMQKYYNVHPEDRNQIENKGGMLGLLSNKMVEYTNMSPKSAAAMKSVAKIGLIIGGGILAWKTIKHIFNIGGVNKDDKYAGWKRGLGAAAVLFGVPMLTGQSIDQLLISGDAKKAWKDMKKLLHLEGVSDFISDNFADLNNRVIYGGLGNIMYEDVSAEQMRKFTVFDEETEKTTLKTKEFKTYRQKQLKDAVDADDAGTAQKIQQKIELLDEAIKTHQEHEITHSYRKSTHYDTVENKSKLCGELYKDFLNAQEAAGKLLADNQNLKIEDQAELDRYIADQIMNKGKKPSEIKLKDLIGHGVIVVVTASPDAAPDATKKDKADDDKADKKEGKKEQKDEEKKDKKEKKDEIQPEAKKENADPLVDREKVETWTKDKWEKFRDGVKSVSITVAEFSASVFTGEIFHRNDSEKLKQARGTLKFAKELLKDLTKRKELQEKTNITEAEIHTVEIEIEELELQAIQMAEMMQDAIDPVLTSME